MNSVDGRRRHLARILPFGILLAAAASPIAALLTRGAALGQIDLSSIPGTLAFALSAAAVSATIGSAVGAVIGTVDVMARRLTIVMSVTLMAAPPAFWWIGLTRLPFGIGSLSGPASAALVTGVTLAPVTLLLVLAASREIPATAYEAARLFLKPRRRIVAVLFPLLRPAVLAGFLLTAILLLGESEIPFLFGFRTSMTDIITRFSRTFDVAETVPLVLPLIGTVCALGLAMWKPLFTVLFPQSAGERGVILRPASRPIALITALLPVVVLLSLAGYAWATAGGQQALTRRVATWLPTAAISVTEPVLSAMVSVGLAVLAVYPARRVPAARPLVVAGLLLFCVPAGIVAIGWIALAQHVSGFSVAPGIAYVSRTVGLCALGFAIAYSRLPRTLDDAARLVPMSPLRRAWLFGLPLLAPSLAATAALAAATMLADRDVASLLLPPGGSRLMLNLYLLSANAPTAVVGAAALLVVAAGVVVVALAGGLPLILLTRSRG